jgi:hypothetical protein
MPVLKRRKPTPAQISASRANGRKGRGPKTPGGKRSSSLNALKTGERAEPTTRPMWQAMTELGEDPARYRSLLRDVVRSYPPQNPLELQVCEQITQLLLKAERTQQALEAKLVRTYQKLESERETQSRAIQLSASYDALQADLLETGLRRASDSPAKFTETAACLGRLLARLESGDLSDQTELDALYGQKPTLRGASIINAFRGLAQKTGNRKLAAALRVWILEEMRDVTAEEQLYYREHVEISPAMRRECLAPAGDREYVELYHQQDAIQRQIDRKIKLLLTLQAASRRAAREQSEEAHAAIPLPDEGPIGWLDSAPHTHPNAPPPQAAPADATPSVTGEPPAGTDEARAIAWQYRLETPPQPSSEHDTQLTPEQIRRIDEVYGLSPDPEESASPWHPNSQAGHSEGSDPTHDRAENSPVKDEAGSDP